MARLSRITNFLWFADQAEDAASFYVGIFPKSHITRVSRYSKAGQEIHGRPPGSVMVVHFVLDGHPFAALNGGQMFTFNEAVSFQVNCDSQEEIDHYWARLGHGGDPKAQVCGWLKDKYGVSWQVVPRVMESWWRDPTAPGAERAMEAMLKMKKLDLAVLERAYRGE